MLPRLRAPACWPAWLLLIGTMAACRPADPAARWPDATGPGTPDPSGRAFGHPPRFEDYPAGEPFRGQPALPALGTLPDASRFGPALWQGARRGPNFAGHYTIVSRRCGRLCREFVIVDARTGQVHPGLSDTPPMSFRRDSRLLVFEAPNPLPGRFACAGCSAAYYVWNDPRLELIPPETWVGSAPPPLPVRPLIDSIRAQEAPLIARAGPAVLRPTWDRLVLATRDGTRQVLSDELQGGSVARVYRYRGYLAPLDHFLVEVTLFEGTRYRLISTATGEAVDLDAAPVVSPDGRRLITASWSLSGHDPSRVRIYRATATGLVEEWTSDRWSRMPGHGPPGGGQPVWLDPTTVELDRIAEVLAPGPDQPTEHRERVRLALTPDGWQETRP